MIIFFTVLFECLSFIYLDKIVSLTEIAHVKFMCFFFCGMKLNIDHLLVFGHNIKIIIGQNIYIASLPLSSMWNE